MPKEKKKLKLIIIIILVLIFLLVTGLILYKALVEKNNEVSSIEDFENVKEIIEYNECKYIKTSNSDEDGFEKDIYLEFSKGVIEEDGTTNEVLYDNLTSQIAGKMKGTNFRLIDESKNIIVRIKFDGEEVSSYTINNDSQYFEHLKTRYQILNFKDDNNADIQIRSNELNSVINNNWQTSNLNLGTIDSVCSNYNIYFNEGFKIRNVYNKVFNIIFTKQYQKEVIQDIKTGMSNEEIIQVLGVPTYKDENNYLIGYKNQTLYVFFCDGEISVYRNEQNYEIEEFENLIKEYNETKDYNTFVNKLTDLWPDYDSFTKTNNRVSLRYTLKGITIDFNVITNNGITLYKNSNQALLEDIKNGEMIPASIYTELDNDLIFIEETNMRQMDMTTRNPPSNKNNLNSEKYVVGYRQVNNGGLEDVAFYSRDKENIDIELKDAYIDGLYKIDDDNYIYNISGRGIYKITLSNMQYKTIVQGNESFYIKKIENNIIYYDNTQIEIK